MAQQGASVVDLKDTVANVNILIAESWDFEAA